MILSLEDAQVIDPKITQDDLDAFEIAIRQLTNNNFQNIDIRYNNIEIVDEETIKVNSRIMGLRIGDTVEINYSTYNNGLYVIRSIVGEAMTLEGQSLFIENVRGAMLTKVEYPADIKTGIKKIINYDKKMAGKLGIKAETISRMSVTYYDMNSQENTEGYPASLLSFLYKYEKMRW